PCRALERYAGLCPAPTRGFTRLSAQTLLLLRRGVHWTPATSGLCQRAVPFGIPPNWDIIVLQYVKIIKFS
ncbi:MAG: hypothetical protein IKJ87_04660, partial [Ruminococcus sp.]|nr:hypothetical protein [Ruminococcus sp.]